MNIVIEFGYCILFGVAFPGGIILATFNNIIILQLERYRLLNEIKRPIPVGANNIGDRYIFIYEFLGIWEHVIQLLTFLAVPSNVGIVTITLKQMDTQNQFITFIQFVFLLLLIKFLIDLLIPDLPQNVSNIYIYIYNL